MMINIKDLVIHVEQNLETWKEFNFSSNQYNLNGKRNTKKLIRKFVIKNINRSTPNLI